MIIFERKNNNEELHLTRLLDLTHNDSIVFFYFSQSHVLAFVYLVSMSLQLEVFKCGRCSVNSNMYIQTCMCEKCIHVCTCTCTYSWL